ncbi:MAG TPA: M1 family aminopeptidase [Chitinophagaceae bacterium]
MKCFLFPFLLSVSLSVNAQKNINVLHYRYEIELNDKDDTIRGKATITFITLNELKEVVFDLGGGFAGKGKEMLVTKADLPYMNPYSGDAGNHFTHYNSKIIILAWAPLKKGDTLMVTVNYKGIPSDGLIISRSRFGRRTFFSDNWPDRARHWIPCNDDPSDKASVEFIVTAPAHYKVVSNGILVEEKELVNNKKLTHWKEDTPLPTKIMVIGVADFAVETAGVVHGIPVTSWVFPENKKAGFNDYAQATGVLSWFIDYIGPFPYKKLANVQSKTIFGGMENAGAIFYNEDYIETKQMDERLFAHEISHQWFGDMVTETNFSHLWLSEGFASYLPNIYLESKYGTGRMDKEMKEDRQQSIDFAKTTDKPVVDTVSPYMQLLNANSYQKGGWVLHMLRRQLGDSVFHAIIRSFYASFAGKNADTRDFQKICEQVSGIDLGIFFQQWLYTQGHPVLDIKWKYDKKNSNTLVTITQLQKNIFQFPLEIAIKTASGKTLLKTFSVTKQTMQFSIPSKEKITGINADPNTSLLFDGTVSRVN